MSTDERSAARGVAKDREVEAALLVDSESPEEVVAQIARLTRIGSYRLLERPSQEIRDRYFDTPRGDLRRGSLALRIREVDAERWITLKGDSEREEVGTRRLELEFPWSRRSLTRVLDELHDFGVLSEARTVPRMSAADPAKPLAQLGLEQVQDRQTRRRVRHVVGADDDRTLAELDIDSVSYRFGSREARIHEVEVEAKSDDADLTAIVGALRERVPQLAEWPYGKLPTGKAIEKALGAGSLALGEDGVVRPSFYDELASYLVRGEV